MKINEYEAILTTRVLLVPYCSHHVPTYHEWMQDEVRKIQALKPQFFPNPSTQLSLYISFIIIPFPALSTVTPTDCTQEIQKATASEPLTLSEEHSMQTSWRLDHDKLTFITCHAPTSPVSAIVPHANDTPTSMIGDINLFLYENTDEEQEQNMHQIPIVGEIEIMIAHVPARDAGLATEALYAFLWYISTNLEAILEEYRAGSDEKSERYLNYLRVKIDQENVPSLKLFEKVGFEKTEGGPNYFGEVEMRIGVVDGKIVSVGGLEGGV
ncbi:GNAT domain-containing protein, partial [Phaeosphaeriaceae sp. PMI808]